MNDNNVMRITVNSDDLPEDNFDWTDFDALTDEEVALSARSDPDAQPTPTALLANFHRPLNDFTHAEQNVTTEVEVPVYINQDLVQFFAEIAQKKNIRLAEVIDLILRKEMDLLRFATT